MMLNVNIVNEIHNQSGLVHPFATWERSDILLHHFGDPYEPRMTDLFHQGIPGM